MTHLGPREGITTGVIGAVIVAAFYLLLDTVNGTPLLTPSILGEVLVLRNGTPNLTVPVGMAIAAYTVVHLIAFGLFGLFLARMVHLSERSSVARYGVLQLLVAFLFAFYGVLAVASEVTRGLFPLWGVLAANVAAALAMGAYLWNRHPAFRAAIRRTPLGAGDSADA
ncbi:MAG: hypothetical protein IPP98_10610 [Gemmatimonadetes bacterium]|nr:hypothetical protein [Gemmatimonadota bacterium]MBL0179560.1 hypothetical protein [Gemmatimonadota bacterium]